MAELYSILKPESRYYDKHNYQSLEDYNRALRISTTVYVGNLSFFTTQDSIWELFSHAGQVKDVIMGINDDGNPCGFCFVMYSLPHSLDSTPTKKPCMLWSTSVKLNFTKE